MFGIVTKSIRAKLSISMGIAVLSLIILFLTYGTLTKKLNKGVDDFGNQFLPSVSFVLNADRDLYQAYVAQLHYLLSPGQDDLKDFKDNAKQAYDRMMKFKNLMDDHPAITSKVNDFENRFRKWEQSSNEFFKLVDNGNTKEAEALLGSTVSDDFQSLRDLYDIASQELDSQANVEVTEFSEETLKIEVYMLIFVAFIIILTGALSYVVPKVLVSSVNDLTRRIKEISEGDGDLTQRINSKRNDELGKLASAFDDFVAKLQTLISEISSSSTSLENNAVQLTNTHENAQRVSNEQTRSIEQIAAAVNEFSVSIREVAERTLSTANETDHTAELTTQGMKIIDNSVDEINQLANSIKKANQVIEQLASESNNIATVLEVIRNIAEQTNLLALNAAIEAARAGEQGRGFAVVADEVRSLASKTQKSTEEIQNMIDKLQSGVKDAVSSILDGSNRVEKNVELSVNIQQMFESIQSSATIVSDMATQIATATEQQSSVSEELSTNLEHLNEQNRVSQGLSNEINEVAKLVGSSVNKLSKDVGQFKVG
ncbi:HAMP domain-containing methyl-accepting chemotaxis protein [Vibrio diazotrophicus]|uniref:methyl-accepting chemotaxis protein n=1 Tax=Vibrio diazotrophicus TaxID=685 RepID=UPI0022AF163F|nr:HAMP domain-containing methyl-accepting chemotaxis protein [Vibrio diazotrophicus]MCZ4371161.1 HAMP domain-containing methyl-accepting chemotaxis protein [Vibrio diazotrophicus]